MKTSIMKITEGGISVDDRGTVKFVNDFNFPKIKRFYQVENFSKNTIRAFHGHKNEEKYVYVTNGSLLICLVKINDFRNPSKKTPVERYILSSKKPTILQIPKGYANGFKALENNTNVIFFSTSTLESSLKDDFRYPYDYWGKDVWKIQNR